MRYSLVCMSVVMVVFGGTQSGGGRGGGGGGGCEDVTSEAYHQNGCHVAMCLDCV